MLCCCWNSGTGVTSPVCKPGQSVLRSWDAQSSRSPSRPNLCSPKECRALRLEPARLQELPEQCVKTGSCLPSGLHSWFGGFTPPHSAIGSVQDLLHPLAIGCQKQLIRLVVQSEHHPLTWLSPPAEAVYRGVARGSHSAVGSVQDLLHPLAVGCQKQLIHLVVQSEHHPLTWLSPPAEAVYRGVARGASMWEI